MMPAARQPTVDPNALNDALQAAASRFGRLSDEQVRAMRHKRRTATAAVASASAAAVLALVGGPWLTSTPAVPAGWSREVATKAGQQGTLTLADGSTVRLNGATRVQVSYRGDRRTARLLQGQAFFDVRHDKARPFTVYAGAGQARVLGTAFDVDLTRRQVALAVYRGAVGFEPVGKAPGTVVRAGYRSAITGGVASAPARFDAALPDWRQGWIDTAGMRLDDLVEALDRQGNVRIARPAEPLASVRVLGRFRTDNPRQLLGAIGEGFGFTVREQDGRLSLEAAK
ncbi:FecR family protein [Sphingomonas sp. OV641]|uniref:FecR family protein n=1 Tax=Sphingomonas sp. OV641 TaxID=1881068 RepID=UPI000B89F8D5|nr:FecR domain-containing protein [Sphingomonas sp. OV641]